MQGEFQAPDYPNRIAERYASANRCIRWRSWVNVDGVAIGGAHGMEEVDAGQWDAYFSHRRP